MTAGHGGGIDLTTRDPAEERARVLGILLEAARVATREAKHGPMYLRTGRFRPVPPPGEPPVVYPPDLFREQGLACRRHDPTVAHLRRSFAANTAAGFDQRGWACIRKRQ
jgi:hypothetical protein